MHRQALTAFLMLFLCGLLMTEAKAQVRATANITASLISESRTPNPGDGVAVAILMQPKRGWHGYWKTPGDAGFPGEFNWTLPKGATVAPLRYPVPKRFLTNGLMNHVFYGDYALLTVVKVPAGLAAGTRLPLRISARWLACTDRICVPEEAEFGTELVVGNGQIAAQDRTRFDGWRQKLARPLDSDAAFAVDGNAVRLSVPLPTSVDVEGGWFFPETENALSYNAPQKMTRAGDRVIIETEKPKFGFKTPSEVKGVLALKDGTGLDVIARPGAVEQGTNQSGWQIILLSIGGALIGGLILNIMPCVFPIISLKALSLAKAGGNERAARGDALAYSAGVILTCLALGGALLALRASGMAVGWAFQLQDPRVILFLLLLSVAITLNFAGLFALSGFAGGDALVAKGGKVGSFWTGVLAAFVATPCTGPFMAAALGAALVLPVAAALAVFAGLGLGLALPFLGIAYIPALRSRLPRPGPWMARFQRWMAVPMALTSLALFWLLWRQTGQGGFIIAGAAALLLAVVLIIIRKQRPSGLGLGTLFAVLAVFSLIASFTLPTDRPANDRANAPAVAGAVPFSEARLAALRTEGRPVFLYFTADWCVSCKVNEKVAIDRTDVIAAFKGKNAVIMVGDWSNGDPVISRFLESRGRSGVPLYLWYGKGATEPKELPQILTPTMLKAL
jgi:thiol:disulfide interchange protein